ncbi:MAG: NAD-dependent DNA ligase LigA [Bacteroidales bacterium]|jgi:DNA ligase (NAD+)|nr:NAD-dependent DNA ligase LigA [Bacteroidales bacterium]MBQ1680443.1 NAD-dependent DNA ligase LigA [Bacteroidales bacterium]MBQ1831629.1 NAD-dependent DNA ligase LigA [Bacteroidales bacterium]MBQ5438409.1 NAD-dependent DNA ligase LigA [Bacteroidales bacterium]MBR3484764.1 NAD-dependent DNA ligase LigA [Bacteroidales bacterium]
MAKIGKTEARDRIEFLKKELERHNRNYYVLNAPTISDFEFDLLMSELQGLERMFPEFATEDSPTRHVGSDLAGKGSDFVQVPHRYPMLSLGNTYAREELYEFDARIRKTADKPYTYSCELKFDGTAICLTYRGGRLLRALTRGDGTQGDDVTRNVVHIPAIPRVLRGEAIPEEFEIRGEIYMPWDAFERLNAARAEAELEPFANPRNAASGSLKLQNPEEMRTRGLDCVLYHLLGENLPFKTHTEALEAARSWGLPVSEYSRVAGNIEEAVAYIDEWDTRRKQLPFATDGIVIKVNELDLQRQLGFTAKTPRWATAWKFKPEQALTPLLSVDYQVGRTGAVTPVANLEPVLLSGTVVKRASLHNKDQMDLLDIHLGDYVYVEKGGEIIPKITGVELSKRPADARRPEFPTCCPDCGTPLVRDPDEARHYCPNRESCPVQIKGRFVHFAGRKAMDILAGEATIEALYAKGWIRTLPDLYALTREQLISLEGWQEKSADNFLASLDASRRVPFGRVLYALGIRHIGEQTAKMLARQFGSIDALAAASREDLLQVEDIGETVADSILAYFASDAGRDTVRRLREAGLQMAEDADARQQLSDTLAGKTLVISGNFSISREAMKALIEAHGGKNAGSVSGKTAWLLAGEKAGPEKLKKAEKLGIPVISEAEFRKLIETGA